MPDPDDTDWRTELARMAREAGGPPPSTNVPDRRLSYGTERTLTGDPRYRGAVVFVDGEVALVPTKELMIGDGPWGHQGAIHRRDPSLLDDLIDSYQAGRLITVEAFKVMLDGVPTMRATGFWDALSEPARRELQAMARAHGAHRIELREIDGYQSSDRPPRRIHLEQGR